MSNTKKNKLKFILIQTTKIKSIWVLSCGALENTCSLRASGKTLKDIFRFYFNKVAGQKVY